MIATSDPPAASISERAWLSASSSILHKLHQCPRLKLRTRGRSARRFSRQTRRPSWSGSMNDGNVSPTCGPLKPNSALDNRSTKDWYADEKSGLDDASHST